ncbi:PA2G3-like protein [Mya arenaria]|uniref:PA2G3-like protein n=1 Tax=Mya arenaria TaxID=6604 RepID=A0ABY7DUV3_MYAAR|nr:PA2G3-like protein [Mya arenaria]
MTRIKEGGRNRIFETRFRGCLRSSVSSMASMIGKIYFNILGSKCFRLTEVEVCMERSWWGRCQRYENKTTAAVVNQVSFLEDDRQAEADNHTSSK